MAETIGSGDRGRRHPRTVPRRAARALASLASLASLISLALSGGCGPSGPKALPVYTDLVLDGSLGRGIERPAAATGSVDGEDDRDDGDGGSPVAVPSRVACGDQTRFANAITPGADGVSIRLPLTLGTEPRLMVSACADTGPASLTLTVEGTGGLATEVRLELPGSAGWTERTIDLTPQSGGRATLLLQVAGPGTVYVSDLAVRHLLPPETLDATENDRRSAGTNGDRTQDAQDGQNGPDESGIGARLAALWSRLGGAHRHGTGRVLLISVDTLREDAIGALRHPPGGRGDEPSPTPHLDAFAREAEVWSPHYAAASWTKPSHASLLTGLPPAVHGADSIEGAMIPGARTLAQRFAAAGARTVGLVRDCEWLDPEFGFDRGFESYRVVPWQASQEVRVAETWLVTHRDEDAFFFLHLFTPHSDTAALPYEAFGSTRAQVEERWGVPGYGCRAGHCASELLKALNAGLEPLPDEGAILEELYRRGTSDVDRALGTLFDDLRQAGLWDGTTVIVTSDHGEAFFEHGEVLHTTVHQEIVRVPLMIKWAHEEHPGERHATPTSALDVAPTLLAAAGLPTAGLPEPPLEERSTRRPIVSGTTRRAVIAGPWKAIFDLVHEDPSKPAAAQGALYRLDEDPAERHDVAAAHPEEVARLRKILDGEMAREQALRGVLTEGSGEGETPRLTDEERRRLEALGYLD